MKETNIDQLFHEIAGSIAKVKTLSKLGVEDAESAVSRNGFQEILKVMEVLEAQMNEIVAARSV